MNSDNGRTKSVTENPCNMCMPMGAIVPFKGIEQAMVIIHGSQGCATYMRRHMAEHYNEPIDVASSSITEQGTIYGGEANLKKGLANLIHLYKPQVIGILSTCLAETIGEDIDRTAAEFQQLYGEGCPRLITVPTPGFKGTQNEGYFQALFNIVVQLCRNVERHDRINVIVPNISPADIREIKRMLDLMQADYILFPDYSDTLDSPYASSYQKMPAGGTALADIEAMAGARATIQFGLTTEEDLSPGKYLQDTFGVPLYNLPLPIGIEACDQFTGLIQSWTGHPLSEVLLKERGRLLDAMIDSHKYNREGRAAIFGEPEIIYAVSRLTVENGMLPAVIATGSRNPVLRAMLQSLTDELEEEVTILQEADFVMIQHYCSSRQINVAVGSSDGRFLTEHQAIPLVRLGFPIHDRIGGQRLLSVGFAGTTILLDRITNTLLANKYSHYRQTLYDRFYEGTDDISDYA